MLRAAPRFACKFTLYSTWTRSGYAFLGCKQQMGTAQAKRLTKIWILPSGMGLEHLYRPLSYTHIKKETRAHTSLTVIHRNALYRGRKRESQRTFMMKAARTTSLEQAL